MAKVSVVCRALFLSIIHVQHKNLLVCIVRRITFIYLLKPNTTLKHTFEMTSELNKKGIKN